MLMFTAPGTHVKEYDEYDYFTGMVQSVFQGDSPVDAAFIADLKAQIQNSDQLTAEEKNELLAVFPVDTTTVPTPGTTAPADWQTSLETWYLKNIVIISLIQWAVLLILLIKTTKSN